MTRSRRYEKWSPDSRVQNGELCRSTTPSSSSWAWTPAVTSTAGVPQPVSDHEAGTAAGDLGPHLLRNLVAPSADGRSGVRGDPGRFGAERGHGLDRGRDHPRDQTGPSRVGGRDDSGHRIGEQYGGAVRGEHREREPPS